MSCKDWTRKGWNAMTPQEELWLKVMGMHAQPDGIPSEFEEGSPCMKLYDRIDDARVRLCERFGIDFEDPDMLEILNCEDEICKLVGCRMYRYGELGTAGG